MTPAETTSLAAGLERLHGEFGRFSENFGRDVGEIKTACAVLVERSARTEQDVRDLRSDMDAETQKRRDENQRLRTELDTVKRHVWMGLGGVLVLAPVAGLLVQLYVS